MLHKSVYMESDAFGREYFAVTDHNDLLAQVARLVKLAEEQNDGVDRYIGIALVYKEEVE